MSDSTGEFIRHVIKLLCIKIILTNKPYTHGE